ncbi:MAG: hypothetical protein KDK12_10920, partial [Rhodobacteraceae bacterium]|nr:hypothetical protein [Paracoccaceae bacterium]
LPELPENMRIATVLERPQPDAPPPPERPASCAGSEALDRMLSRDVADFGAELGQLTRALYGEFDQPDPQTRLALIGLYLSAGFGAEARALIDNGADPVAGRDLALGLADVLEDRASNSRMRLAQAIDCGGAAAVMAAVAGADPVRVRDRAATLALAFTDLPAALRGLVGATLAEALAEAGALDAARIVTDSLQRSAWVSPGALALVEARLDRARGRPGDAAARLDHEGDGSTATVLTRLDLALQTRGALDRGYVADAEAMAATARNEATGPELMASAIRLHARSGALTDAFAALDRLQTWMVDTGENRRMLDELRDEVWQATAENDTDIGLVETILAREDWRDPALQPSTRRALAGRLVDLGLAGPAQALLIGLDDPVARVLRARAALASDDPAGALALLGNETGEAARRTRADALERLGQHAEAGAEFTDIGNAEGAARAAILGADWRRVEDLADTAPRQAIGLGPLLGRAPGHAEVALSESAMQASTATEAARPAASTSAPLVPRSSTTAPSATVAQVEDGATGAGQAPPSGTGAGTAVPDPGAAFDRLGLVRRSSTLLAESERLREALAPLVDTGR